MPRLRLAALLVLACAFPFAGCGSKAAGIDDCRSIEKARCVAARQCSFGIDSDAEEATCERYARDSCLHGLPYERPSASQLNECVKAIESAGTCATETSGTSLAIDCKPLSTVLTRATATLCDIIENPEETTDCSFLLPEPKSAVVPPEPDAGVDAG